jgi:hypothetical protein
MEALCQALDHSRRDSAAAADLLQKFLEGVDFDLSISNDSHFAAVLPNLMDALVRHPFPAPAESSIPRLQLKILQFLTHYCLNHPNLLSLIAAATPLDHIIPSLLERNITEDGIIDFQSKYILLILQFFAAISMSGGIVIA